LPFSDKFALFRFFGSSSNTFYGWLELSLALPTDFSQGPNATLVALAYDDTGLQIRAGQTVADSVPEPSTMALTGLAALALGAVGLRQWRAARKAS
jgi:hypothetical protein